LAFLCWRLVADVAGLVVVVDVAVADFVVDSVVVVVVVAVAAAAAAVVAVADVVAASFFVNEN
jgi:hypothetical protein